MEKRGVERMIRKGMARRLTAVAVLVCLVASGIAIAGCGAPTVVIATTGDMAQSPLYGMLIEAFEKEYGMRVKTETYSSSMEVLEAGTRGEADALLVGNKAALDEWMGQGYALSDADVFYSEFLVIGPEEDPAEVRGLDCPAKSCKKIGMAGLPFVARGDGSDLDAKVKGYWVKNGLDPTGQPWYTPNGGGMAATLQLAGEQQAYTICDMSTWLSNGDDIPLEDLKVVCTMLMNQYSLVVVDPGKFPDAKMNTEGARKLAEFMVGETGQSIAGAYEESGVVIYHPNATRQMEGEEMGMEPEGSG
jgi:tungstate transport system substrate-binding protein